jgi:hypothetical protein
MDQLQVDALQPTGWVLPPGWYGFVASAGSGILRSACINQDQGMAALRRLGEPDCESRDREFDGRRLVRIDGGYVVLNFQKFRDRDYTTAERSKRYRERQRHGVTSYRHGVTSRDITQAEVEEEVEAEEEHRVQTTPTAAQLAGLPSEGAEPPAPTAAADAAQDTSSAGQAAEAAQATPVPDLNDPVPAKKIPRPVQQMNQCFTEIGLTGLVQPGWEPGCQAEAKLRIKEDSKWPDLLPAALDYLRSNAGWFTTHPFRGQHTLVKDGVVQRYVEQGAKRKNHPATTTAPTVVFDPNQQDTWDQVTKLYAKAGANIGRGAKEVLASMVPCVGPGTCAGPELVDCLRRYFATKPKFPLGLARYKEEHFLSDLEDAREGRPIKTANPQQVNNDGWLANHEAQLKAHPVVQTPISDALLKQIKGVQP